ncbi:MAG: succinylglutamate desuccinylase/aspartoacylase family protein [Aureispira sp.]|nr:succinylglutamate desuccinylase/aspartoacylase family protein [Aureispira sp.]
MKILGTTVAPGECKTIQLSIARLHTGTPIDIPIVVARAKKEGPCLLLTAGIHGDEINGVEIVRQVITKELHIPEKGTVICVPVINVFGYLNQERDFPDGRDLNRMFPGFKRGSLASRFAYHIINEVVPHIDYCIDFHTGGASRFNYSQIRLDAQDTKALDLAKIFGSKFIINAKQREKSFRHTLRKLGKSVLLFEGGKSLHLDRIVTKVGIQGVQRVMHHLDMRDYSKEITKFYNLPEGVMITKSSWVRAKHSGMFRSHKKIGSLVAKGDKIGTISDPYGSFETAVKSTYDGYIICANHAPIVHQGDALFHITRATTSNF